jgi:glycosyltransferase involved in cell wall biosynthesis
MKIAACLIVRNEAEDIAEWIAYHIAAGFDTILAYDNASSDATLDVLQAAARVFDVRITPWNSRCATAQVKAYDHAIATNRTEFDWIAVLDSDEFLVFHGRQSVHSLCNAANDAAAIGINWAMFGTNGHIYTPRSLVIEAFTRRAMNSFDANRHVKSIVRPDAVDRCLNPHAFRVHGRTIAPNGTDLLWCTTDGIPQPGLTATQPNYGIAQVNHYFTRSRAHWARKTARGYPNPASRTKLLHFAQYDRNEIEDYSALRNLDAVRRGQRQITNRIDEHTHPPAAPHTPWCAPRTATTAAWA